MTTPARLTSAAPDDPPGTFAGATVSIEAAASSLERVQQTLQNLEQLVAAELSADPPLPEELCVRVRSLCHELREAGWTPPEPLARHVPSETAERTEFKLLDEQRRKQRQQRLADVFEHAQEGVVVLSAQGTVREVNSAFLEIAERTAEQSLDRPLATILEWAFPDYDEVLRAASNGRAWNGRVVLARGDRNERTYLLSFSPLPADPRVDDIAVLFSDVTEFERTHRRLKRLALHDQLTGLPNRRFYRERVRSLIERCHRDNSSFAVCFIDLDDFKEVNDSLGHTAGDELLVQVAQRLRQHAQEDAFVARLGGDEFAMLIPRTDDDPRKTATVADNVLRALREPISIGETIACIGASLGVTEYPAHSTDIDQLLQNADVAMYAAKKTGRNQVCVFAPDMKRQVEKRNQIQLDLQRAVRGNEISLRYQAQVDLKTGCLSGCEALARWRTPDGRDIMPGEFVPVAETSGLVVPLGEVVLMEACRQACEWEALDVRPPRLAVNISPQHLHSRWFTERVAEILEATGAQAEWLMLEVTEDAVMQDVRHAMLTMDSLVEMGLTLAIDDFGTGRSSFSYLKQFNIHALKIDRSFINDLPADPQARSMVESMIHLGQGRQLQIVAEGIENEDQYQLLCEMGCDIGQGFHIARPLRATALECWWDETTL